MIPHQYQRIVFSVLMALSMSCIMSLVVTIFNVGWVEGILSIWLNAWLVAFTVATPTIFILAPLVNRLVALLVRPE